jgi:hypothetical protein
MVKYRYMGEAENKYFVDAECFDSINKESPTHKCFADHGEACKAFKIMLNATHKTYRNRLNLIEQRHERLLRGKYK